MQKNEVVEFLEKIDAYVGKNHTSILENSKFKLKIIGKCALFLAGMTDSAGTVDLDSLRIESGGIEDPNEIIIKSLMKEFGIKRQIVHGYYIEFVGQAMVFLPHDPQWMPLEGEWKNISVEYLEPNAIIASKCFSAFSKTPRKKDLQDVSASLDQKLVHLQKVLVAADSIFNLYSMDSRSNRFPEVYKYLTKELIPNYGGGTLKYSPPEE